MNAETSALPWDQEKASELRAMAIRQFSDHFSGHMDNAENRENCSGCVLGGYEPRGSGWNVRHNGPNYSGWARLYVQAGHPIPKKWQDAFNRERHSENERYSEALERDIATFGLRFV